MVWNEYSNEKIIEHDTKMNSLTCIFMMSKWQEKYINALKYDEK